MGSPKLSKGREASAPRGSREVLGGFGRRPGRADLPSASTPAPPPRGPRCEAPRAWTESPGGAGSGITWVSRPPPLLHSFSRSWSCEDAFPGLRPELDGHPIPAGSRAKLPPGLCLTGELEVFIFCSDGRKHVKFIKGLQGFATKPNSRVSFASLLFSFPFRPCSLPFFLVIFTVDFQTCRDQSATSP